MSSLDTYSTVLHCLYDQPVPPTPHFPGYSIFRGVSSQNVEQKPNDLPLVHDFAVFWDDDHDIRIIQLLEEMLFAGLLPGVQFIGEHKGELNVILAARTFFQIDSKKYGQRLSELSSVTGDRWTVRVGMIDVSPASRQTGHQCDYVNLIGLPHHETDAFLVTLDAMWQLGTKKWIGFDAKKEEGLPSKGRMFDFSKDRYTVRSRESKLQP